MRKLKLALSAVLLGAVVMAAVGGPVLAIGFNTPNNQHNEEAHPLWAGYKYKRIDTTSETVVCAASVAPCVLAGLYMSTGAAATGLFLRDTAAADGNTSGYMFPRMTFDVSATGAYGNKIPAPVRADNGITAKLTSISAVEEVVVLYLDNVVP